MLTGRQAREIPLNKLNVWAHVRAASNAACMSTAESAADDDLGFAEYVGVDGGHDELAKKNARHRVRCLACVEVSVVTNPLRG